jgi:hypothetical protein
MFATLWSTSTASSLLTALVPALEVRAARRHARTRRVAGCA